MKKTYKLLGYIWDGLPRSTQLPDIFPFDVTVTPLGNPDSLFDYPTSRRVISLTRVLSIESHEILNEVIDNVRATDIVYLLMDYRPSVCGKVVWDFYWCRVAQIVRLLQEATPNGHIRIMEPWDAGELVA